MKTRRLLIAALVLSFSGTAFAIVARDYGRDLATHQREILACAGTARGTVTVEVTVSGRGRITESSVVAGSTDGMRQAGACVLREARSWQLQSSTSGGGGHYQITVQGDRATVHAVPYRRR